jgi:hypothetical protein
MSANLKIISDLRNFITLSSENSELKKVFTTSPKDFSRKRKLHFELVVCMLLNFFRKSYAIEISEFFSQIGLEELNVSKSAFSQQRLKINSFFFNCLNTILVESFYTHSQGDVKRWNELRLIAIDGSTSYLIDKEEVTTYFGTHGNQRGTVTLSRVLCAFDVLNKITIKADMYPISWSEQKIALGWLPAYEPDMLLIYDRAYPGFNCVFHHQYKEQPQPFLMRAAVGFSTEVIAFVKGELKDAISTLKADKPTRRYLKEQGFIVKANATVEVRMIKVVLDDGTIEVLITNLFDQKKYPYSEFKTLYFMRWGIETRFDSVKNQLQLEAFSGQKVETILQDFFATIFLSNLQEIIGKPSQKLIEESHSKRKYAHQINKNIAIGLMKNRVVGLFLSDDPEKILLKLQKLFARYTEPIRPNRKVARVKTLKRRSGKYKALTNYKRAI